MFLDLSWQVGMLLVGNTDCRSASLLILDMTLFGSEVNPVLASLPNVDEYGEHMIPE